MRNGFLGCVVILAGFGAAAAQPPGPVPAMPFVMSPPPGLAGYGAPPGMPYLPPQPAMPFVMPPPDGMPGPGMLPPMPPDGMLSAPLVPEGSAASVAAANGDDDHCDERQHLCNHVWGDADLLLFWIKAAHTPPLLTTGSAADAVPGALGQAGTSTLFGGDVSYPLLTGGHFDVGAWLAEENGYHFGVQGEFFFLGQEAVHFAASSTGTPVLAQPFLDVVTGAEGASPVALPGAQSGQYSASLSSRLWGAEFETRSEAIDTGVIHIDTLAGLRYVEFLESLDTNSSSTFANAAPPLTGLTLAQSDHFGASNYFYGAEIGVDGRAECGPLSLRLLTKVAFGDTHQVVDVRGSTNVTTALAGTALLPSGFLALPTNSGRHGREAFTVVPETDFTIGYAVTKHLHATVGYSLLYDSNVLRPGDQIDRGLNMTQIPPPLGPGALAGPARPAFAFHDTDFWAQGVKLGLEFQY